MSKELTRYNNGNTHTILYQDGTKERYCLGDKPVFDFPESLDVKITNYCDLNCPVCHESSTTKGKHASLNGLFYKLRDLPPGVELAIGGGNPLSHPKLEEFLMDCHYKGWIVNLTVNQGHLKTYFFLISELLRNELIKGIGVSITSENFKYIKELSNLTNNLVYHLIIGINKVETIEKLKIETFTSASKKLKVLLLGYKDFGFGKDYLKNNKKEIEENIQGYDKNLINYIDNQTVISFDNLALEQLNFKKHLLKENWERFYLGDDFSHSMYIDAVEQVMKPTSRSYDKTDWKVYSLLDYFNKFKNK